MTPGARVVGRGWGWRHAGRRRWAVADIDLTIEPGERVLLLGASGAGKSTLLRAFAGVLGGDEDGEAAGELTVDGQPPASVRGVAGMVLQDPDAQVILARVGDDVAFGCENLGVAAGEIWPRVGEALDAVGLSVPLDHPTSALSGGQKQRLALAGALAMRPKLLLLDEPTANLDPDGARQVRDAVAAVAARTGATLVVVEHRVDLWVDLVDRVVVLAPEGGVLADGVPADVFATAADALTQAGVWVPGVPVEITGRPRTAEASPLVVGAGLAVGRRIGRREALAAASGIDVQLSAGRALAITGANGAGKSTLALTLAGLLPSIGGEVRAADALAAGVGPDPSRWRAAQLLTRIGTVFQEPEHQLLTARVRDELAVGPRALGLSESEVAARVDPLLERLRLGRLAEVNPFTLSGGEKRRLTVAAVLATAPRVILLDEPTYGQDARTWRELADLIDELRSDGTAIGFVSHDPALVGALADDELRLGRAS
ncbi:ATP-binding cassette domain-containing protein [Microbacterium neimengense]